MPEWNWRGRDRITGAIRGYFSRGSWLTAAELKDHVQEHFQGIEFVDATPADKEPAILIPIDPRLYQHGALDALRAELGRRRPRGKTIAQILCNPLAMARAVAGGKPISSQPGGGSIGSRLRPIRPRPS